LILSAFIVVHLSALILWTLPPCQIKDRFIKPFHYYMLPLGLWQWWAIFAPDPIRETTLLDAEVVDCKGMRYVHEFPRIAELSWWQKIPRYRQPKYAGNMASDEFLAARRFAARHAVRQLGLGPESFPVWVSMYYQVKPTPAPGTTELTDAMAPPRVQLVDRYQFDSIKEVRR
jgi:hypothetical protein